MCIWCSAKWEGGYYLSSVGLEPDMLSHWISSSQNLIRWVLLSSFCRFQNRATEKDKSLPSNTAFNHKVRILIPTITFKDLGPSYSKIKLRRHCFYLAVICHRLCWGHMNSWMNIKLRCEQGAVVWCRSKLKRSMINKGHGRVKGS